MPGTERNIKLFYVIRGLALPFFWLPILYFYLTQIKGFSPVQTTFLLALQEFLSAEGHYPEGLMTAYFGPRTREALARFQAIHRITPAAGYFGPMTRARANLFLKAAKIK